MWNIRRTATLVTCLGALVLTGSTALAERKSPLEGQPAIRHRYEMRKGRFELGPAFGFTINRSLRHAILFGAKLQYHLNDWLSLGADFGYGIGIDSGLTTELKNQCGTSCIGSASDPSQNDDVKAWDEHQNRFSNIQLAGDIRVNFTPVAGKMGIFSKLFIGYDFYIFGGLGLAMLSNKADNISADVDGVSQGFRVGPAFGIGMHLFFTKFFSMGVEIKDIAFSDNESGGDVTRGLSDAEIAQNKILVDGDDKQFSNHWLVGINFTFFLPAAVEMSR
jgi:outer membrane beta-barrel protein